MRWLQALTACVLAVAMAHEAAAERWIVPAAAHVSGAGDTDWRTDLRLTNPTETELTGTVTLLETGTDNSALDRVATITVPALGQVAIRDVLDATFAFSGTGALLVECADRRLVATSRTYNQLAGGGTYGQYIPAVAVESALGAGERGELIHLSKTADFRSNVGFAGASAAAGRVTVELYGADGALLGSVERDFLPYEHHQFNDVFAAAGAPPTAAARAVFRTTAPVIPYASVVDRRTGDPVAIMLQRLTEASTELVVTAAARAAGAQSSVWRSDLRVFNPNPASIDVTLVYHKKGVAGGSRPSTTLAVGPGAVLAVDDVMLSALGLSTANGGLRISAELPVLAWSRTYNLAATGSFGQSIPAVAVVAPVKTLATRVFTLPSNLGFRTNVGFFNTTDTGQEVGFALLDGAGSVVGEDAVTLEAGVMDQINDLFDHLGAENASGEAYWLAVAASSGVLPYLSVSDNASNDPSYEPGTVKADPCELGLPAAADATIRGGDFADTRHGHYTTLLIKGIYGGTFARKSYMVFDLSGLPQLKTGGRVMLKLTASRHVSTIPRDAVVTGIIDNDDWNPGVLAENLITWNNAPRNDLVSGVAFLDQGDTAGAGVRNLATLRLDNTDPPDTTYLIDVTDFVNWAVGGDPSFSDHAPRDTDGLVTLMIANSEEISGVDGTEFYSSENAAGEGCFQPQLVVVP